MVVSSEKVRFFVFDYALCNLQEFPVPSVKFTDSCSRLQNQRIRASAASAAKIETYFWTLCSRHTPGHRPSQFWTMVRTTATFTTWWTGRGLFWTLPTRRRQTTASARSTPQLTATSTNESNFSPARPNHDYICRRSKIRTWCDNYAYVNIFRWKFYMNKRLILGILYTGFGKKEGSFPRWGVGGRSGRGSQAPPTPPSSLSWRRGWQPAAYPATETKTLEQQHQAN